MFAGDADVDAAVTGALDVGVATGETGETVAAGETGEIGAGAGADVAAEVAALALLGAGGLPPVEGSVNPGGS